MRVWPVNSNRTGRPSSSAGWSHGPSSIRSGHVIDTDRYNVPAAQFAVVRQVEKGEVTASCLRFAASSEPTRRGVAALGKVDADGITFPVGIVIFAKVGRAAAPLDPHERIGARVECNRTVERLDGDAVASEPLTAAGQTFVDDVFEQTLAPPRLRKRAAVQNTAELLADRLYFAVAVE